MRDLIDSLIARALVTRAQVDEALRTVAHYGGALDTALLEATDLGELELQALLEAAHRVRNSVDVFSPAREDAVRLLRTTQADKYRMVPFRLVGRVLDVVVNDPTAVGAMDDVAFITGCRLVLNVATEARVAWLMERAYGLPMPARLAVLMARSHPLDDVPGPMPSAAATKATSIAPRAGTPRRPSAAGPIEIGGADHEAGVPTQVPEPAPEAQVRPTRPSGEYSVVRPPNATERERPTRSTQPPMPAARDPLEAGAGARPARTTGPIPAARDPLEAGAGARPARTTGPIPVSFPPSESAAERPPGDTWPPAPGTSGGRTTRADGAARRAERTTSPALDESPRPGRTTRPPIDAAARHEPPFASGPFDGPATAIPPLMPIEYFRSPARAPEPLVGSPRESELLPHEAKDVSGRISDPLDLFAPPPRPLAPTSSPGAHASSLAPAPRARATTAPPVERPARAEASHDTAPRTILPAPAEAPPPRAASPSPAEYRGQVWTGQESLEAAFAAVEHRDEIPALLFGYLGARLERQLLFFTRGVAASGWDVRAPRLRRESVEAITLSLLEPSVLKSVCEHGLPFLGALPFGDVEESLLVKLGGKWPEQVLLWPVRVNGETAVLLYGEAASAADLHGVRDAVARAVVCVEQTLARLGVR